MRSVEDEQGYAENDLASGSDGACDIIRSHEECAEDQAAAAELSQHIAHVLASEDKCEHSEGQDICSGDPDGDHLSHQKVRRTDQKGDNGYLTDGSRDLTDEHSHKVYAQIGLAGLPCSLHHVQRSSGGYAIQGEGRLGG